MLSVLAVLYFTGWITPVMGGLQSLVLATGIFKPDIEAAASVADFDYNGLFTTVNGEPVSLSSYKGKTLFINLWATWCPPCRAEMPHIAELYKKVEGEENLEFMMIALDEDFEKSKKYIGDKRYPFPLFHASHGLNPSLQSQSIPTTLVVDPSGKIVFYHEGMSNFNTKAFQNFLLSFARKLERRTK